MPCMINGSGLIYNLIRGDALSYSLCAFNIDLVELPESRLDCPVDL
jgi:hypothetical protein